MKDKVELTVIVCTTADSPKVPLVAIGKSKVSVCFRLCENFVPPITNTN